MSAPRLLLVAPSAYPLGGVATWLDGLVAGLRQHGWDAEVALLAGMHHDVGRYLERHRIGAVRRIASASGSREGRLRSLAAAIVESDAELVLAVNVGDIEEAVDRVRRAEVPSLRLVVTQHGLQRDFYDHLRAHAPLVDGVVVTNRLGLEIAALYSGIERSRLAYAPYGVETPAQELAATAASLLRIAWVGRLEQAQKRIHDLPAICDVLESRGVGYRLTIAGSGPEEERLRSALSGFAERGHVTLLGDLPPDRLRAEVYATSDVLLITSSWETGPIVAWEALASGLAIVSARYLGVGLEAALRDEATALLFPVGDAVAAAAQLERTTDPELRRRLMAAGRAEIRRRYSLAASIAAWERALRRLAATPPLAARSSRARIAPAGRLDRWLGVAAAESVRSALGIRHAPATAGDEWPHVRSGPGDDREFAALAARLDRGESADAGGAR